MVSAMGADARRAGVIMVALCALVWGGALPGGSLRVVGYAPIFVVAGLLLAQGLALLRQFVLEPLPRVAAAEGAVVVAIVATFAQAGMAWGMALGGAASIALFTSKVG